MISADGKNRCFGYKEGQELYARYHDMEWGIPVYDDQKLFEMLILEGAQAGLNWETILKKREAYRKAFHYFDIDKVIAMPDDGLNDLCNNEGIIRNKSKIFSVRNNAKVFSEIQKEFGTFSKYLWEFVNNKQIKNSYISFDKVPGSTKESIALSKDLKKRGMKFVGPVIIYAYMQAVGLFDDHLVDCWCYTYTRS